MHQHVKINFFFLIIPLIMNYWIMTNLIAMLILMFILIFNKNLLVISYMMLIWITISFGLIMLSIWITFLMHISSKKYNNMFNFLLLLLMMFMIMTFFSSNLITFCIFFESRLIPKIIIMGWGHQPDVLMLDITYYFMHCLLHSQYFYLLYFWFILMMGQLYI